MERGFKIGGHHLPTSRPDGRGLREDTGLTDWGADSSTFGSIGGLIQDKR